MTATDTDQYNPWIEISQGMSKAMYGSLDNLIDTKVSSFADAGEDVEGREVETNDGDRHE